MKDKVKLISELLLSVSGVILFLSISRLISLNGLNKFAPIIAIAGIAMLFWAENFARLIPIHFIKKPLVLSVSHVLIFLGIKDFLGNYMATYWVLFILIGVILLNYNKEIARLLLRK